MSRSKRVEQYHIWVDKTCATYMFVWLCIDLFKQIHLLMSIKLRIAKLSDSFQQELKFRKILKKGLSIGKHKFKMKKKKINNQSCR